MISLPKLYAIANADSFQSTEQLIEFARQLQDGGCQLIQYRSKSRSAREVLQQARELKRTLEGRTSLMMNDRADLAVAAACDGVHVGQDDLSPEGSRKVIGPNLLLGISTHNPEQVTQANLSPADYIAVGPVFATSSKANPDPVIGLDGVRRARRLTAKPLLAIGGITRANCRSVIEVGADSVAVISDLSIEPRKSAEEFLRLLG